MSHARPQPFPLIGIAVDVRSLYNVGALFRASDAARVEHLYLCGGTGHPADQRARIEKTALGTTATVPWTYAPDALTVIAALQRRGVTVAALEITPQSELLGAAGPEAMPLALVVGHEVDGVPPAVIEACDRVLALPTYGTKRSLNVALAYGAAMLSLAHGWAMAQRIAPTRPEPPARRPSSEGATGG